MIDKKELSRKAFDLELYLRNYVVLGTSREAYFIKQKFSLKDERQKILFIYVSNECVS